MGRAGQGGELELLQPSLLPGTAHEGQGLCHPSHSTSQTGDTSQALPQLWGQLGQEQTQGIQAVLQGWAAGRARGKSRLCQDFCPEPWMWLKHSLNFRIPNTLSAREDCTVWERVSHAPAPIPSYKPPKSPKPHLTECTH